MPLSVNVGLSRKASKDYQSTGVSINVTAELDQSLLARPDELQRHIDDLYAQAEQALDRRAGAPAEPPRATARRSTEPSGHAGGNGYARNGNGNGHTNGSGGRSGGGQMTESQRKAILAIARRVDVDPAYEAREIVGAELDDLTLRQASELIDHLKAMQPAANGRNGR